jgi:hypothetical protein
MRLGSSLSGTVAYGVGSSTVRFGTTTGATSTLDQLTRLEMADLPVRRESGAGILQRIEG